jgi:hypothetical protein
MAKDSALAFIGQIQTEHKAVLKADGDALKHAIECGKYLALAKENVEAAKPKRKWSAWLSEHCPDIHQNTAALYMRLADPDNADAIADCKSIRQADMALRQPRKPKPGECGYEESTDDSNSHDDDADDHDDDLADNSQRVVKRVPASPDLTTTLLSVDVDEVCAALIDAWDEEHIRDLCNKLHEHFAKPAQQAPDRRPPPPPPSR